MTNRKLWEDSEFWKDLHLFQVQSFVLICYCLKSQKKIQRQNIFLFVPLHFWIKGFWGFFQLSDLQTPLFSSFVCAGETTSISLPMSSECLCLRVCLHKCVYLCSLVGAKYSSIGLLTFQYFSLTSSREKEPFRTCEQSSTFETCARDVHNFNQNYFK